VGVLAAEVVMEETAGAAATVTDAAGTEVAGATGIAREDRVR
jgi:hypothetical protein